MEGVSIAKPAIIGYDEALMWDHIHLNARGVDKFAPVIAQEIQRVLHERDQTGR
jgi:lysophospholipase L1-like esterase